MCGAGPRKRASFISLQSNVSWSRHVLRDHENVVTLPRPPIGAVDHRKDSTRFLPIRSAMKRIFSRLDAEENEPGVA
jgi:hypothetical protein